MARHRIILKRSLIIITAALAMSLPWGRAFAFDLPDGASTCSSAEIRRTADAGGSVFLYLNKGQWAKVKAINGEFYKVILSNQKEGYIHNSCLDVSVWAKVVNTGAWIFDQPMASAKVTGDLRNLSNVRIINRWQNWYEVVLNDRRTHGWVEQSSIQAPVEFFNAWLMFKHETPFAPAAAKAKSGNKAAKSQYLAETQRGGVSRSLSAIPAMPANIDPASLRYKLIAFAEQFLGTPYVWGGQSTDGFDCSGFTQYVFSKYGVKIERVAGSQAQQGIYVAPEQLLPGDLVFFGSSGGNISHVGMYIGGGNFIHASSMGKNGGSVQISPLFTGWYSSRLKTQRRIIMN